MATTKKAAAKRRPTAKKAAPKPRAAPAKRAAAPKKAGIANRLKQLDLTGVAGKLVEGRRKDLQAIVEANKKSYAGIQAVCNARPRCSRKRSASGRRWPAACR